MKPIVDRERTLAVLSAHAEALPADLDEIQILGSGTALYWPHLDLGNDIPGLLDGIFGTMTRPTQ